MSFLRRQFEGEEGREALVAALAQQWLVNGDHALASELAGAVSLVAYPPGAAIMAQGAPDNDICLVLAGQISVQVNGREVVTRGPGQHVGEMALIDPRARRSASVFACEETVVARVAEPVFTALADRHPGLWRALARELGERLRARDRLVPSRNAEAQLLIAASTGSAAAATALLACLDEHRIESKIWSGALFGNDNFLVDALLSVLETTDFVVLVLAAEDLVGAARDNLIFEVGLCIGLVGRERVLLVVPEACAAGLPADLVAPPPLVVRDGQPETLAERLAESAAFLSGFVATRGPR